MATETDQGGNILTSEIENVSISKLRPYAKNPRVGNVEAIAESLKENKQYRPIVVNKRTDEILAGNHTMLAARKLGWDTIAVVYVDVDEDAAKRIVLADNRTNDLAEYDELVLAELLDDVPDLVGTGYDEAAMGELLADLPTDAELVSTVAGYEKHKKLPDDPDKLKEQQGPSDPEELTDEDEEPESGRPGATKTREPKPEEVEATSVDAQSDELPGMFQVVSDDVRFELEETPWDIPPLKRAFIPTLPEAMDTWVGPAVCTDEPGKWWLYNYSSDSTRGLAWERTYMAFYVFDHRWENWWENPAKMVTKMLNSGCDHAVMPDFSIIADNPKAEQLWQTYRNFWLARFMQECGVQVVPNLLIPSSSEDLVWTLSPIPERPPSLALQLQTVLSGKSTTTEEGVRLHLRLVEEAIDHLRPETLLMYTSDAVEPLIGRFRRDFMRIVEVPTRWRRIDEWRATERDEGADRGKHRGGDYVEAPKTKRARTGVDPA